MLIGFIWPCPAVLSVHLCSICSLWGALWFDKFIRVRWVHSDAHWGYSGSFGFDGSFLRVLDMVVFIGVRWVHLGAPLWSSGSLMLVGFIRALPWGCRLKWVRRVQSGVL